MPFLIDLVVAFLNLGKLFGHVLLCEAEQQFCNRVAPECLLEIGYKIIPADYSLCLGVEIADYLHFFIIGKTACLLLGKPHSREMFLSER